MALVTSCSEQELGSRSGKFLQSCDSCGVRPGVRLPAAACSFVPQMSWVCARVNFRERSTTSGPLLTQSVNRRLATGAILPHIHAWSDTRYMMVFNLRRTVPAELLAGPRIGRSAMAVWTLTMRKSMADGRIDGS